MPAYYPKKYKSGKKGSPSFQGRLKGLVIKENPNYEHIAQVVTSPNPIRITKAYNEFLDSNRDLNHTKSSSPERKLMEPTNKDQSLIKARRTSTKDLNLMRQKLNSSQGRKHFIVAYNLSETLRENKLELECNDYKKIKELITDIQKKRFETRANNLGRKEINIIENIQQDKAHKFFL